MKIPFIGLKAENLKLRKELSKAAEKVFAANDFILGREVFSFEREFAAYCGGRYAVGVNSGTDALFLSLLSMGIGKGDEVICPVYTYIATALSISYAGAKPVFADIDARTFNIDAAQAEKKITRRTRAIIPVHLYGQPADMGPILRIARAHNLKVLEDASQAHGAVRCGENGQWRKAGSMGDAAAFSFYPTKNLSGCGDGGMILTNSKRIHERLLILRDQGRRPGQNRYLHFIKGYNSRLDSLQAAWLRVKLSYLDEFNRMRRENARKYSRLLAGAPGITVPYEPENVRHVFHVYALLARERDALLNRLRARGIQAAAVYHQPLHLQPAYRELGYRRGDFPAAEEVCRRVLCLPMSAHLSEKQIEYAARQVRERS